MNLEVGMYVRIDKGKIGKIIYIKEKDDYPYSYVRITIDNERYTRTTRNVIKASHNPIDLIEVGDYVNGIRICYIDDCKDYMRQFYYDYEDPSEDIGHYCEDIKTIVTKEQFEKISYKVEEDNV